MAKIIPPLHLTKVKSAKPKEKDYELLDGKGLILRVRTSGSKQWVFRYKQPLTKKRTKLSLGDYPQVSLDEAREKHAEARALLAEGIDPKEHRDEQVKAQTKESAMSLENVAKKWFDVKKHDISADFADDVWRSLEIHIFPTLGNTPLSELNAPDVIDALEPAAAKGSYETIRRVCQRINEIMDFATNTGVIQHNPLSGIKKAFQTPAKNNLPTIQPDQLPELMKTISEASIQKTTRYLIHWQLHTISRPGESSGARWEEIDTDKGLWTIPAERMKKKKVHRVPLTPQMLAILDAMKPICGNSPYIFPAARNPDKPTNESTANMALKRMGYHNILVAHGLRSLASTTLNEQGFDPDIIETALAHEDKNEVRRAYNRAEYLERRRVMMCWWSEHIVQGTVAGVVGHPGIAHLKSVVS